MNEENLTEEEIKRKYNTTKVIKCNNFLQVQHYQTKEYHYFVWGTSFWRKLDITSLNPQFFQNWIGE